MPELSQEPCYTCRRRHVKCDRILPSCAKCAKKGVQCLGYQKPLRWADGVAVRGKLKGKRQPVVDGNVVNAVRSSIKVPSISTMKEAQHVGLPSLDQSSNRGILDDSTFQKLVNHPRNAAVHMASCSPGDQATEHLALETKVRVFQHFNTLLQSPQDTSPDLIVACGLLIFAMDLLEHGLSRWRLHFQGTSQVMHSFGGIENLYLHYPHLQSPLMHAAHIETFWIILSPYSITRPKQACRKAVDLLCHASSVQKRFFNPCPTPLTLAVWDIGYFASKLTPPTYQSNSSTSTPAGYELDLPDPSTDLDSYFQFHENSPFTDVPEDASDPESLSDFLTVGPYFNEPWSRSPSPLPSPYLESDLWHERYELHNKAFFTLVQSLTALHDDVDLTFLRHILTPLIILALVSRPASTERELCFSYLAKHKQLTESNPLHNLTNSRGREELNMDIPWDKLDAFSASAESGKEDSVMQGWSNGLTVGAPEWNWWDMLSDLKLELIWPIISGTGDSECGSEFWAFKLISSVINEECFAKWV
ncbi:hypothetical protein BU24DRAFT_409470 [Aaosphaeria arxii CBS 175.79]|uniref:Zn(2)-C6 fungal-type domain-containing protein n=1 Tax=Aaosphaeria arxii CBS 175.79 TaxID=1450172 RepID=A0A6A5XT33_9PLEO|nr:uncharacterized protein BU24DRAFT_409470 [Aaosphaeria arxii CBS 175.79]KAF2016362.1 hypothetical protein BU24DRAFT_409470 [Aaosphaeria arxii CBS 175.79]